jgi:hypothetical protein
MDADMNDGTHEELIVVTDEEFAEYKSMSMFEYAATKSYILNMVAICGELYKHAESITPPGSPEVECMRVARLVFADMHAEAARQRTGRH